MEKFTFIDRYFHSHCELLDVRYSEDRDINTLFTYLTNLHSTADKFQELFKCDIKSAPEFKILRFIRNYSHHVDDVNEIRLHVRVGENVIVSHSQHLLIPLEVFAKSVKSFIDNNTVDKSNKNYKNKIKYIEKEMDSISKIFDYTANLQRDLDMFCSKPCLKLDGKVYELGFDMYKFVHNITNTIADKCKEIPELKNKKVIRELDSSYTTKNNIGKHDVFCSPFNIPITTTDGFIYAKKIERA